VPGFDGWQKGVALQRAFCLNEKNKCGDTLRAIPHVDRHLSVFVEVFFGHVVLRHLMRVNFSLFIVFSVLDTCYDSGFESVPFLK
jgi:hypothetical protein